MSDSSVAVSALPLIAVMPNEGGGSDGMLRSHAGIDRENLRDILLSALELIKDDVVLEMKPRQVRQD